MEKTSLTAKFGLTVKQLRLDKGTSQEKFAEMCGLHRTYVGAVERGEKTVTIETALKIAEALKLPLSELLKQAEAQESVL